MRKLAVFLLFIFLLFIFLILISFLKTSFKEFPEANELFNQSKRNESYSRKIPEPPKEGLGEGSESQEIPFSNISKEYNITFKPRLEIFDICSAQIEVGSTLGEGGLKVCYNDLPPYYVILEKYDSQLNTSFYGGKGFNQTYNFSEPTKIFMIFIQDLLTVPNWESVEIFGELKDYFSLGDYALNYVWEPGLGGNLTITRQVISIPLIASPKIPKTEDWSSLEFYVKAKDNLYFVGKIWFFVV